MLTADLVNARRYKRELRIVPLDDAARARAAELATAFLAVARTHVGRTREEYEEACAAIPCGPRERRLADGIRKLIEDRCDFDADESLDPEPLRREVFLRSAAVHQSLADDDAFDRDQVLAEIAAARDITVEALERALYSDLRAAQLLKDVRPQSAVRLAEEYDLAQAQAVLLRAVRVTVEVGGSSPAACRALFGKLKFLRLLHTIQRRDGETPGYTIEIDGPFSLFESVTKYGLQLALALPSIAECREWKLSAEVRWGKERQPLTFRLEGQSTAADAISTFSPPLAEEVEALVQSFASLETHWRIKPATMIFDLPGIGLCVPDLTFENPKTRSRVHLEIMGYWSRDAVWRRVELVEKGLPEKVLFAVGKHLRVSEAALDEDQPGALYTYKRVLNAKAILEKVEALAARPVVKATGKASKRKS